MTTLKRNICCIIQLNCILLINYKSTVKKIETIHIYVIPDLHKNVTISSMMLIFFSWNNISNGMHNLSVISTTTVLCCFQGAVSLAVLVHSWRCCRCIFMRQLSCNVRWVSAKTCKELNLSFPLLAYTNWTVKVSGRHSFPQDNGGCTGRMSTVECRCHLSRGSRLYGWCHFIS